VVDYIHVKKLKYALFTQTEAIEIFAASAVNLAIEYMLFVLIFI
jgi:hypothetical protein